MISYFIQVSICWALFFLLYTIWLRKETFFNLNRWYLLTTIIAGLLIPLVEFQYPLSNSIEQVLNPAFYLETITVTAQAIETNLQEIVITPVNDSISLQYILMIIYSIGFTIFSVRDSYMECPRYLDWL